MAEMASANQPIANILKKKKDKRGEKFSSGLIDHASSVGG